MSSQNSDKLFIGSIPEIYEKYLVPLIFEEYAQDLAQRVKLSSASNVLEIAAGTGVVTRAIADAVDDTVSIISTDLNQDMLNHAASVRKDKNVKWQQADALALPFEEDSFDVVVCQFGVMFFPDRIKSYSEALRVLKPEGRLMFNVWDPIEDNEFADTVTRALQVVFPEDPPQFLPRTPHGYSNREQMAHELKEAGFASSPSFETLTVTSRASSPSIPAIAYCQGTPLRNEIEARDSSLLETATEIASKALRKRFGEGEITGKIQGKIVTIEA